MKYNIYHIGSLALALSLAACSSFLKEDSGDLLIPERVSEYQTVLYGEGYPNTFSDDVAFMDLMTDDVSVMDGPSSDPDGGYDNLNIPVGRGAYLWHYDVEYYIYDVASAYENRYKNILACNTIIENESTMIGTDSERNFCVAQAYALRAFNYFCLVNWYGLPYNKATAASDMGVAIRLDSEVTREQFKRSTVQQVYDQINKDLDRALELFAQSNEEENIFLMSKKAALLLKSRVALFTENWDDVIAYGNELYETGLSLENIGKLSPEEMDSGYGSSNDYSFIKSSNPEILFTFGGKGTYPHKYMIALMSYLSGPTFATSQTEENHLINIYENGDNRLYAFFEQDKIENDGTITRNLHMLIKYFDFGSDCYKQAFRSAEALLNLAEGYARKGGAENKEQAIALLNELRESRFTPETFTEKTIADFATDKDLIDFIWAERRRELCFDETHRWIDLRREGMPQIVHKFRESPSATEQTYILEQGDRNYTLALPSSETSYNTEIETYTRRDILPQ